MRVAYPLSAFSMKQKLKPKIAKNGLRPKQTKVKKNLKKTKKQQKFANKLKIVKSESEVEVKVNKIPKVKEGKSKNKNKKNKKKSAVKDFQEKKTKDAASFVSLDQQVANYSLDLDSDLKCEKAFQKLIYPITPSDFFRDIWEQKPIIIRRHNPDYYKNLLTCQEFDEILRKEELFFTTNIDVTLYTNGKRQTLNPNGRAHAASVWSEFEKGCSIRLLNPQTFSKKIWQLMAVLQEYFNCGVGANMYLTPAGSQGFAPHYDDIEAFVIQLEGQKKWKLYGQRDDADSLPRTSSGNFTQEEIGDPILDVVLNQGDMLYFPRGTIHQACTPNHTHSLHLTISTYQRNSWADLLEKLVPRALEIAIEEDIEFRKGVPRDYLSFMGVTNCDLNDSRRQQFISKVETLMKSMLSLAPIDATCDQLSKDYVHNCLPPFLSTDEKNRSMYSRSRTGNGENYKFIFKPETEIKLLRNSILRLVAEEELVVYHSADNSRIYHEREIQSFEIDDKFAPAVEVLQHFYPKFIRLCDLPLADFKEQNEFAFILFNRGLILTKDDMRVGRKL